MAITKQDDTLADGHYGAAVVRREGDLLTSPLFPGLHRGAARVFAEVVPDPDHPLPPDEI